MGASELLERIRNDGRDRAAVIRSEKASLLAELAKRLADELTAIAVDARERETSEAARIVERARGRAGLTVRNAGLAARWQALERVVAAAEQCIVQDQGYEKLIAELVQKYARPDSEVRLSEADTKRFGTRLTVKPGAPVAISGGVLIRTGRKELNFALHDALVAECEVQASELSRLLFPER